MTVFLFVFCHAFVCRSNHTLVCHIHTGHKADREHKKQEYNQIFFQSPISSFGILLIRGFLIFFFFIAAPLPFQIFRGYLVCIDVVVAHRTVTELDHMVCHIFDRLVMCNHNDGISVFFVDLLNQL